MRNSCLHIAKCTLSLASMHVFFELAEKPHKRQTFNENKKLNVTCHFLRPAGDVNVSARYFQREHSARCFMNTG